MRKQNLEFKFTDLEQIYNVNEKNNTSLLIDIKSSNEDPYSLSPAFESVIERYCWVPKNNSDVLSLDLSVQKDTKIYLNNKLADSSKIKISAKDGPQEYNFIFRKDDQIAKYSLVCLPVNFPPLNINITNSSMVADGNIFTSVFIVPKIVHWPLIIRDVIKYFPELKKYYIKYLYQNIRTRINIPKIVKHQTEKKLTKSRKYLPYIMMLDKFGVPIWYKMAGIGFSAFRPYKNGYYYGAVSNYPQFAIGLGKTVLLDQDFNIESFKQIMEKDIYTELHEFQYLDDDTVIQIGSKTHKFQNQKVESGIISIENEQKGTKFLWDSIDHVSPEFSKVPTKEWGMNTNDYFHMNAVRILKDGNYLASARHTQTIMKIDKTSGKILWHMGKGKLNNFKFVNDPYDGFSHQHAPEELENGNILIWDNGIDSIKDGSRVVEYKIDEISYTATLVWSKEFKNLQANVAGNCHNIGKNSYIAAFGSQGYIEEFNKDGTKVLSIDPGGLIYQVRKS